MAGLQTWAKLLFVLAAESGHCSCGSAEPVLLGSACMGTGLGSSACSSSKPLVPWRPMARQPIAAAGQAVSRSGSSRGDNEHGRSWRIVAAVADACCRSQAGLSEGARQVVMHSSMLVC